MAHPDEFIDQELALLLASVKSPATPRPVSERVETKAIRAGDRR